MLPILSGVAWSPAHLMGLQECLLHQGSGQESSEFGWKANLFISRHVNGSGKLEALKPKEEFPGRPG